jgi:DUF1365 family protein
MTFASGLYAGVVTHARVRPRAHRLRYRVFMLLIDLDEAPRLGLRLLGHNRFNLLSFNESAHGDGSGRPLKAQVEGHLADAGLEGGGAIRVLSMPAILGAAFNPLTVYFCHAADGRLSAILYEVNNTFGQRHSYLLPVKGEGRVDQTCAKDFYVSPFMDMSLTYDFHINPPGRTAGVAVRVSDEVGLVLNTAFSGRRAELTDAALLKAWLAHPWMTLGVLWAIHWEALKIWLKGERLRPRPPAPAYAVTLGRAA